MWSRPSWCLAWLVVCALARDKGDSRNVSQCLGAGRVSKARHSGPNFVQISTRTFEALSGDLPPESLDGALGAASHTAVEVSRDGPVGGAEVNAKEIDVPCGFLRDPLCLRVQRHSCSGAAALAEKDPCPAICPFVVADRSLGCAALCAPSDKCTINGPQTSYDNSTSHRCQEGPVPGCLRYGQGKPRPCLECMHMHRLLDAGTCSFSMRGFHSFTYGLLGIVLVLLLVWVLPVNIYRAIALPVGNVTMLKLGWKHRERCLVSQHSYDDPTQRYTPYPLSVDVHTEPFIAGAGLCLYYNSLRFVGVSSAMMALCTFAIHWYHPLPGRGQGDLTCLEESSVGSDAGVALLQSYHAACAWLLAVLWLVLLLLALAHGVRQHRAFRELDSQTSLMADFVLSITGLPLDAEEPEIYEYLAPQLQAGEDAIVGISVAYDFFDQQAAVTKLLDQHLFKLEQAQGNIEAPLPPEVAMSEAQVRELLREIRPSGTAFAVFVTEKDRDDALEAMRRDSAPLFEGRRLRFDLMVSEPTTLFWSNFVDESRSAQLWNGLRELSLLVLECVFLSWAIYSPTAHYIFTRANATGHSGGSGVMKVMGLLITIVNSILYNLVNRGSLRMGFTRKGSVDACNLIGCVVIVLVNTIFTLAITFSTVWTRHQTLPMPAESDEILSTASVRSTLAEKVWNLLVPGLLVAPYIFYPLFVYLLSIVTYLKYWISFPLWPFYVSRDLRSNKDLQLPEAEAGLESAPIQIEFDYANNVCVACSALVLLFFETEYAHKACLLLVFWAILTHLQQRYCHLRVNRLVEYTNVTIDEVALYLWALPVSMVAGASSLWFYRSVHPLSHWQVIPLSNSIKFYIPFEVLPAWIVFAGSMKIYVVLLSLCFRWVPVNTSEGVAEEYDAVRPRLRYDFFNTNPVRVLRSHYLDEGAPLTFFKRGKEHLQQKWSGRASRAATFSTVQALPLCQTDKL